MKLFNVTSQHTFPPLFLGVLVLGGLFLGCAGDINHDEDIASLSSWSDPPYVAADYNYNYNEWRWYFDISIAESAGIGVNLQELSIAFYSLDGILLHEQDYTPQITDWFGSTWLNAFGTLTCRGTFWTSNNAGNEGWVMVYSFTGRDEYDHTVTTQCDVTGGASL